MNSKMKILARKISWGHTWKGRTGAGRELEKPCLDRSRRDFAIVCDLLRLGLTREQIWPLVRGSSKFESNGRKYFELTIANAESQIVLDQATVSQVPT